MSVETNSSRERITLGIADDHVHTRKNFVKVLRSHGANQLTVMVEADNGRDLLTQLKFYQPQIILMDIRMPVMDGIEATLHLRDLYPKIGVIVYTQFDTEHNIIEMNKLGVKSFIDKAQPLEEVIKAIQIVKQGGNYFPASVSAIWANYLRTLREIHKGISLDDREYELLKLLCQGLSSTQIATLMNKSPRTIEEHRTNLCKKFGVANKEQLIAFVSRNKII